MGWDDIDSLQIPLSNGSNNTTKERVEKNEITVVESSTVELLVKRNKKILWSDVVRNNHSHTTRVSNVSTGKISIDKRRNNVELGSSSNSKLIPLK